MTPKTFLQNFVRLADAPNGIQKLRELILQLAVQGNLVPQDPADKPMARKECLAESRHLRWTIPAMAVALGFLSPPPNSSNLLLCWSMESISQIVLLPLR